MRGRWVGAGCVIVALCSVASPAAAAGTTTTSTTPGAAEKPSARAIVSPVPEGWYLLGAAPPVAPADEVVGRAPFYATSTGDGAALTVGSVSCDGGCPTIRGEEQALPAPLDGRIVRSGRFAWATVFNAESPGGDAANFVAARDLTNAQVIAAVRAATVNEYGEIVGIGASGLPDGVREAGNSRAGLWGIPYGAERITLLRADGGAAIDVWTYVADRNERRAQRFWSQQAKLMNEQPQPPAMLAKSRRDPVLVEDGRRMTVVVGAAGRTAARSIAGALQPATDARWEQFRGEVAKLPAAAILPGADGLRDAYVVDGYTNGLRWVAAGASTDAGPNEFHYGFATADHGDLQKSSGLLYAGQPVPAELLCGALEPWNLRVGERPPAMIALGLTPTATARVTLQIGAGAMAEATLGPVTADGQHRYVSGPVPLDPAVPARFATATAYDGTGQVLATTTQFGILTCA